MHRAVVSILGLVALAIASPLMSLMLLSLLSLVLLFVQRPPHRFSGLWRSRWLLLTIFVLYSGFTPGEPIFAQLPGLSREGMMEAARRMLILIVLIQAVGLLIKKIPLADLTTGVGFLLWPLQIIRVDHLAFARRLSLTLEQIDQLRARLVAIREHHRGSWADAVAQLIGQIESTTTPTRAEP